MTFLATIGALLAVLWLPSAGWLLYAAIKCIAKRSLAPLKEAPTRLLGAIAPPVWQGLFAIAFILAFFLTPLRGYVADMRLGDGAEACATSTCRDGQR